MYKIISILLSIIVAASLSACNAAPASGGESEASAATATLQGEIGGEITVSAYDTMRYKAFLEDAARLFEEKYPGSKVTVETFSAMPEIKSSEQGNKKISMIRMEDDPQGRQDYINKVNTSMMGGEGADILAMDVLPVHKYADGGQLENLEPYMESDPDFNRSDYRENIFDAASYKNGLWFLPVDYTFDYYAYDTTLITGDAASGFGTGSAFSTGQLMGVAESSFDGSAKLFNLPDYMKGSGAGMWGRLLSENYAYFVDLENKTANFGDGKFAGLLETVKQYGENGYVPKGVTGQKDAGAIMRKAEEAPTERYFFKPKNIFSLMSQFTRGSGRRMNIMTSGGATDGIEDDDDIAGIAGNADNSIPFTYNQAYGINSNSKNKQTAWAFIKFLLGEDMQLNTSSPASMPVLNSARERKAELMMSGAFMGQQGQPLDDAQRESLARYNEAVELLSDQINDYVFKDTVVNDMITAETAYFFEGTKTAAEVADTLQNKVGLYLGE